MTKALSFCMIFTCLGCARTPPTSSADPIKQTSPSESNTEPQPKQFEIKAQFNEFSLGDASHHVFSDETGTVMDFAQCIPQNCNFGILLPEEEVSESNQGWGSNKELIGKWFLLTYEEREQELYIDGPMGMVMVITKFEAVTE